MIQWKYSLSIRFITAGKRIDSEYCIFWLPHFS